VETLKPSTRREKVERREDAIIHAARLTFMEKGFAKATMAEIARQSGIADGTVYLYFKNKDDLARSVVSDFYRRLTLSAQKGVDELQTVEEQLRFLACHHMESIMAERRILEMLPVVSAGIDSYDGSELFDLNKNYVVIFDRIVKRGQSEDVIRSGLTLWILRDIFFGAIDYGFKTMMLKSYRKDINLFADELLSLILVANPNASPMKSTSLINRFEAVAIRMENALAESDK